MSRPEKEDNFVFPPGSADALCTRGSDHDKHICAHAVPGSIESYIAERDHWKYRAQTAEALVACKEYSEDLLLKRAEKAEGELAVAEGFLALDEKEIITELRELRLAAAEYSIAEHRRALNGELR